MNIDLTGRKILVTGGSRGIGRAICERLIASGADVCVHYNTRREEAERVAALGRGSIALGADLSRPPSAAELVGVCAERLGGLDGLVNNAAVALSSPMSMPIEEWAQDWSRTLDVNLVGAAVVARLAIEKFQAGGGGHIVFIASRAAFRGDAPEYQAYAASKGGMVALSRSIARGLGKDGVKSFVVAPGFTDTDMARPFIETYGEDVALKDNALGRLTRPEDIAPIVAMLLSGLADHATGTSIDINAASYVR